HPVGATRFANGGHESLAEHSGDKCRACHGTNGEGTVLSVVATDRSLSVEGHTVSLAKGEMVSCNLCHENEL
ncbi:MAG TPA: cytochrome C, partial [Desulfobacteria bacterium]|nr:cytochrome C [Desulfobacteria bacterium]